MLLFYYNRYIKIEKEVSETVKGFLQELKRNRILYLMMLPMCVMAIIFCYVPMTGIILAFKNYNYAAGIFGSEWVGLKNFEFLFKSGNIGSIIFNTFEYNWLFVIVNNTLEIGFAIVLSELHRKRVKKTLQSIMFLPYFISWVIVGTISYNMFNYEYGVVNNFIRSFGGTGVQLMNSTMFWRIMLVVFSAWKAVGYGCVVYLSTITGIDTELYDAAAIDGATIFQRIRYVTFAFIKPTLVLLFLLTIGGMFRGDFGLFWQLTGKNALIRESTEIIDTYVYRCMSELSNYGMTTAAGFLQSIMGFVLIVTVNKVVKKVEPDYTLF